MRSCDPSGQAGFHDRSLERNLLTLPDVPVESLEEDAEDVENLAYRLDKELLWPREGLN